MEHQESKIRTNWNAFYIGLIATAWAMFAVVWFEAFWIIGPLFFAFMALTLFGFVKLLPILRRGHDILRSRGALLDNTTSPYLGLGAGLSFVGFILYMIVRRTWL